jgi:putative Mg2+ transporter-C (MgtC) family protein
MEFSNLDQPQYQILIKLALAMLLGGVMGFEREIADKPAGLRTHMLVAGAAAFLVALSEFSLEYFRADLGASLIRSDPIRILEAVIAGVSFLGAGTIIRRTGEGHVEGLTTAASMLFVTAVGVSVALDQYIMAVGATVFALVILRGVGLLDMWIAKLRREPEDETRGS